MNCLWAICLYFVRLFRLSSTNKFDSILFRVLLKADEMLSFTKTNRYTSAALHAMWLCGTGGTVPPLRTGGTWRLILWIYLSSPKRSWGFGLGFKTILFRREEERQGKRELGRKTMPKCTWEMLKRQKFNSLRFYMRVESALWMPPTNRLEHIDETLQLKQFLSIQWAVSRKNSVYKCPTLKPLCKERKTNYL